MNVMSSDDNCFVCGKKGDIGHHCPQVQCYSFDDFGHFAQDCPKKIVPSGTPHHHNRSCSHSHHNHGHRDRSHTFHHRHGQGNCLDRSGAHHWSKCDRSTRHHWRHAPYSISHHNIHSCYPSTDRYPRRHSCRDTPHCHRWNTFRHSSCWHHSQHCSTGHSWSSLRHSSGTTHRFHTRKVSKPCSWTEIPHRPLHHKKVTIKDSQTDSSLESDGNWDILNY